MYTTIDLGQIAQYGVTYWLPLASAANIGQAGAALAVAFKTKSVKTRSLALPSSLSAFMGITEPAIFGVNLRFVKPFVAGCVGGGLGAIFASIVGLAASVTGIFGLLLCLNQPLQYIIMFLIAAGISFGLTYVVFHDPEDAPAAGTVTVLAETGHALGMTTDAGAEVLMHIGIDTVTLEGKPFTAHVKVGEHVEAGQLLMDVDLDTIRAAGLDPVTPVIVTNTDAYATVTPHAGAAVRPGDALVELA